MLAAVLKDFDRLVLEQIPTPQPEPGQILVRSRSCGFCTTDFKAIKGARREARWISSKIASPAYCITARTAA